MHAWIKRTLVAGFFGLFVASIYLIIRHYQIGTETIQSYAHTLQLFVSRWYVASVIAYMGIVMVFCAAGMPLTVVLTIAAGFLFGWIGALYALVSITAGSFILFLIARYVFGDPLQSHYGKKFEALNRNIAKNGATYLLIMNLLPFTPLPLLSIAAGIEEIHGWTFIWPTFVGMIPQTLLYTYAGIMFSKVNTFSDLDMSFLIMMTLGLAFLVLGFIVVRRMHS